MIGRLKGILGEKQAPHLLIDVNGVGYDVEAPMSTFYSLPRLGESLTLLTHLVVREDAQILYGFASDAERALFRALIRVNGIGPKLGLTILSGISVDDFRRCIESQDTETLTRLPGVGKKTAERLVIEMRDRIAAHAPTRLPAGAMATAPPADEAQHALIALGYRAQEAAKMVRVADGEGLSAEEIIRQALKNSVSA